MNIETMKLAELAIIDEALRCKVFPLYTKQGLAERWGISRQVVTNWSLRHTTKPEHFPEPIEGLIVGSVQYYPLYEVERYERARGLK